MRLPHSPAPALAAPPTGLAPLWGRDWLPIGVLVSGALCGRAVARVLVEQWLAAGGAADPLLAQALGTAGLLLGLACWAATRRAISSGGRAWPLPLALAGGYLLHPLPSLSAAIPWITIALAGAGLVALSGLGNGTAALAATRALTPSASALRTAVALAAALGGFLLYLRTLAPSVLPADSGEFQFAAATLAIAHPPTYPLYTLVGRLAIALLPFGDAAYRVNLLSAVAAAVTLALLAALATRLAGSAGNGPGRAAMVAGGLVAAGSLAVSSTWWSQATVAAVRTPTGAFVALLLVLLVRWEAMAAADLAAGRGRASLRWLALAIGFALTHHLSAWMLVPAFAAFVLVRQPRLLRDLPEIARLALLGAAPLLVYAYLPLRAATGTPLEPPRAMDLARFKELVLAEGFRGDMFRYLHPALAGERLAILRELSVAQFGALGVALAALGALLALQRRPLVGALLLAVYAINTFIAITYRAPVITDYLIPSYLAMALWIGLAVAGAAEAAGWLAGRLAPRAATLALVLAAVVGGAGLWLPLDRLLTSYTSLDSSSDRTMRRFADEALAVAEPGAIIFSDWHHATPLWYLRYVERVRPDLEIEYLAPPEGGDRWVRRVEEELPRRPVYLATYEHRVARRWHLAPAGPLLRVYAGPAPPPVPAAPLARFAGGLRLVAAEVPPRVESGGDLAVRLTWQAQAPLDRPYTVFLHLVDGEGRLWGQRDSVPVKGYYPTTRWQPGEAVVDAHDLALLPGTPPGRYRLLAGLYDPAAPGAPRLDLEGGGSSLLLAEVEVVPQRSPPATIAVPLWQPFEGGVTLVGYDLDFPPAADEAAGPMLRTYWLGESASPLSLTVVDASRPDGADPGQRFSVHGVVQVETPLPPGIEQGGRVLQVVLRDAAGVPLRPLGAWRLPRPEERLPLDLPGAADLAALMRRVPFDHNIVLADARLDRERARPGETVAVTLVWEPVGWVGDDFRPFVHLDDAQGHTRAHREGVPIHGAFPTLRWARGQHLHDLRLLSLPRDLPPGEYRVVVGLYPAWTGQAIRVLDPRRARAGEADRAVVARLLVE